MKERIVAFVLVVLSLPVLQGAGCRAHYQPNLSGKVVTDEGDANVGKHVFIIFRKHQDNTKRCTTDWAPCMNDGWEAVPECNATERGPTATIASGTHAYDFKACTGYIGVDYHGDVGAFVDTNDNGRLDTGEPYGLYRDNPLWREKEASAIPLEIKIDRVMP